jgi:DNA polymerase alpha subunit A
MFLCPIDLVKIIHRFLGCCLQIESGETDAWLSLGLMFHLNVLLLTRQLTNISGNLWNKTLHV